MSIHEIKNFDPDYSAHFEGKTIIGYDLLVKNDKIGSVENILVDERGRFRYLVVNTGLWVSGKKILLPIGATRINDGKKEVHADNLDEKQVKSLPEYRDSMTVDFDHEEAVRKVYRKKGSAVGVPAGMGVGYGGADTAPMTDNEPPRVNLEVGYDGYDRDTYDYDLDADLYTLDDNYHGGLKRYQERLAIRRK